MFKALILLMEGRPFMFTWTRLTCSRHSFCSWRGAHSCWGCHTPTCSCTDVKVQATQIQVQFMLGASMQYSSADDVVQIQGKSLRC